MAKYLVLRSGTFTTIQKLLQASATGSKDNPVLISDNVAITDYVLDLWTRCICQKKRNKTYFMESN